MRGGKAKAVTVESLKSAHFNDATRIIDTAAPYTTAKLFLDQFVAPDKTRTIHHHRGAFYRWKENAYPEIVDTELRSELYDFLDRSFVIKNGKTVRVKPNQAMVTNVLDGLRGASHLSGSISAPAWLRGMFQPRKSSHVQMASCICQHSTCFPERQHFLRITRSTSPLTKMRHGRDNGLNSCISFGLMTPNPSTHCKSYSDIA
jgi:hypothetical protein